MDTVSYAKAAAAQKAVDAHEAVVTGNPHGVTATEVGLGNVANVDTTNADNISDGVTNAVITLTQETNFETAYTHSQVTTGNPHAVSAADVGLGNVTNESKATMFTDAALTSIPTAPTAATATNTTQIATTAFVQQEIAAQPLIKFIQNTTSVTPVDIDLFAIASYAGAKVVITATEGLNVQISELLLVHNGSNLYATQYGDVLSNGTVAIYDVSINVGQARLTITSASANSTDYIVSVNRI